MLTLNFCKFYKYADNFECNTNNIWKRGGLDSIFGGLTKAKCIVTRKDNNVPTMRDLLAYIVQNILVDREKDLCVFMQEENVRPGILVLINDTDWELEGELNYKLNNDDLISFTSTLHGG